MNDEAEQERKRIENWISNTSAQNYDVVENGDRKYKDFTQAVEPLLKSLGLQVRLHRVMSTYRLTGRLELELLSLAIFGHVESEKCHEQNCIHYSDTYSERQSKYRSRR
jgi:hypothetical protein